MGRGIPYCHLFFTFRHRSVFLLLFLFQFTQQLGAHHGDSSRFNPGFVEFKLKSGFVVNHHPEMWKLTRGFFTVLQIGYQRQSIGRNPSAYFRNYPRYGLSYLYTSFGNSAFLGKAHAAMTFVELPIHTTPKSRQSLRIEGGLAYLTKTYDRKLNYWNQAISSNLNASVNFGLITRHKLSSLSDATFGVTMLHLSNGTIKSPNFGLNIPSVEAGLVVRLSRKPEIYLKPEKAPLRKGTQNIRVFTGIATKETVDYPDKNFLVYTSELDYSIFYNNVNCILTGLDVTYDQSSKLKIESQGYQNLKDFQQIKLGVTAGHEWMFSWFHLGLHLGYYIYNLNKSDDPVYNKISLSFFVTENLYTALILKSHYAKADFLAAGIGINL